MTTNRHATAVVDSDAVAPDVPVGALARVERGAAVAAGATIGEQAFVGAGVSVAAGAVIGRAALLQGLLDVGEGAQVGAGVVFAVEPRRGLRADAGAARTLVREHARIGSHSTLLAGVTIGAGAEVRPGALVDRDVPSRAVVEGHPARIVGYTGLAEPAAPVPRAAVAGELPALAVEGTCLHRLPLITDLRGALSFGEIGRHLPFVPKRYFAIFDVPGKEVRGEHAHRALHQFLVCLRGSCAVVVDNGRQRQELVLDSPDVGLHIRPMVWGIQYRYTPDTLLLVLASDVYDEADYIRNYDDFTALVRGT